MRSIEQFFGSLFLLLPAILLIVFGIAAIVGFVRFWIGFAEGWNKGQPKRERQGFDVVTKDEKK